MKKPEDEAIRARIIEEYRTKPLHMVLKYMKDELHIDARYVASFTLLSSLLITIAVFEVYGLG